MIASGDPPQPETGTSSGALCGLHSVVLRRLIALHGTDME